MTNEDSDQPVHWLCALCVAKDPGIFHADSKDSDQTGRIPRLAGCPGSSLRAEVVLLVLSCSGSYVKQDEKNDNLLK